MSQEFSYYTDGDSMATDSQAPSAFLNEDDSLLSEANHMAETDRSGRSIVSIDSEYSKDASIKRLVGNLNDVDNQFNTLIGSQGETKVTRIDSEATIQDTDVRSLQDELSGARLASPSNSIVVETVNEASCHESGFISNATARISSAGATSLGGIQEEEEEEYSITRQRQRPLKQTWEETLVETVDEQSCHESGVFSSDRRRSADSTSLTGIPENNHQEEFDPSFYKRREEPPSPSDGYETTDTSGGFSNVEGMGASTEPQWDNLRSTLDQETEQVRNSPYYNMRPDGEGPISPGDYDRPNTNGLRRELDGAALEPPNITHSGGTLPAHNHDVEAPGTTSYWQGDKGYSEQYDDEHLDDSLKGGNVQTTNNALAKTKESPADRAKAQLTHIVGSEDRYRLLVKALGGCIAFNALWIFVMIIVLAAK